MPAIIMILVLILMSSSSFASGVINTDVTYHKLTMELFPDDHALKAVDEINLEVKDKGFCEFLLGKDLIIRKLLLNGRNAAWRSFEAGELLAGRALTSAIKNPEKLRGIRVKLRQKGENTIKIQYEGVIYDTLRVPQYSRDAIAGETSGIIGAEGIYLSPECGWYPYFPDDFFFFSIKAITPSGYRSVTEGKLVMESNDDESFTSVWEANYPTKDVTIVAGKYVLEKEDDEGITVMAYFFPSEKELIPTYVKAAKRYLNMYNRLIGPYPFSKFAIIENFFPTGFGMPSYTLLGRRVIRLPFIVYTSLGHEVAHNWWGNSVYPDYGTGNWCEGLTVYVADHRYKLNLSDSAGVDYRRALDISYSSYVHEDNDFPLSEFIERTSPASRAIGYGKCAMVFHMLNKIVGEETFYRALRTFYEKYQFKVASWSDIRNVFEKSSGKDLGFFFDQWVKRKGAPKIDIVNASTDSIEGDYELRLQLKQQPVYRLFLPLSIEEEDTTIEKNIWFSSPETTYIFRFKAVAPRRVRVDPHYDLFRRLDPLEIPPTISSVMGDKDLLAVLPTRASTEMRKVLVDLSEQICRSGKCDVKEDTSVTVSDLEKRSLLIMGNRKENVLLGVMTLPDNIGLDNKAIEVLKSTYTETGNSAYVVFRSPFNLEKSICVILGMSPEAVEKSGYKIIHYGKYSFVTFRDGKRIQAGMLPVENNPMVLEF